MSKSEIEIIYENYQTRDDHIIEKDGVRFYRMVNSHHFEIPELQNYLEIIIPWDYMNEITNNQKVNTDTILIDENGNHFQVLSPAFIRFGASIPEWYLHCGVFSVKWIDSPAIGNYVGVAKQ